MSKTIFQEEFLEALLQSYEHALPIVRELEKLKKKDGSLLDFLYREEGNSIDIRVFKAGTNPFELQPIGNRKLWHNEGEIARIKVRKQNVEGCFDIVHLPPTSSKETLPILESRCILATCKLGEEPVLKEIVRIATLKSVLTP